MQGGLFLKLRLLRRQMMLTVHNPHACTHSYDAMSAHTLFRSAGVSQRLYKAFLEPMLLVTLFAPPTELSAAAALGGCLPLAACDGAARFDVRRACKQACARLPYRVQTRAFECRGCLKGSNPPFLPAAGTLWHVMYVTWLMIQTLLSPAGTLYYFALAHQADFDVRWCRGPVGERILAPFADHLKALGVKILGVLQ